MLKRMVIIRFKDKKTYFWLNSPQYLHLIRTSETLMKQKEFRWGLPALISLDSLEWDKTVDTDTIKRL